MSYRIEKWTQMTAPNPAMLRYILVSEGYQVFQWCDQPNAVYGDHKHDKDQSHWIISGALELTVERVGTFILEAGDRDFMPANTYHSARVVSEESVMYLVGEKL
jgi:quercetin dioxygenase-like cupin family protein